MTDDVNRFALPTGEKIDLPKMRDLDNALYRATTTGIVAAILMAPQRWYDLCRYTRDTQIEQAGDRSILLYRMNRVVLDASMPERTFEILGVFPGGIIG